MSTDTRTGGRPATQAVIGGGLAIAVGKPTAPTPDGFEWRPLNQLARLETGHTPSRRHPEYWNGEIPWIGIRDATGNHGRTITQTLQTVTQEGLDNSSARLLPAGTVCLSRTASVGFVVVMGVPMATSQDFVNWVCGPELDPRYLKYVLQADREALLRFANGSTHQTIYFPEVKAFHALLPPIEDQRAIAATLGALDDKIDSNRRVEALGLALLDVMSEQVGEVLPETPLGEVAAMTRVTVNPGGFGTQVVEHFSLPAFDAGARADAVAGESILSNKIQIPGNCILVSRLNPRTNRTWWVTTKPDIPALASTEWDCLTARDRPALAGMWLAVRDPIFRQELANRVTGTSGSHQRVRPDDLQSIPVPDFRGLPQTATLQALSVLDEIEHRRSESAVLADLRDALLPELLSGRTRVAAEVIKDHALEEETAGGIPNTAIRAQ